VGFVFFFVCIYRKIKKKFFFHHWHHFAVFFFFFFFSFRIFRSTKVFAIGHIPREKFRICVSPHGCCLENVLVFAGLDEVSEELWKGCQQRLHFSSGKHSAFLNLLFLEVVISVSIIGLAEIGYQPMAVADIHLLCCWIAFSCHWNWEDLIIFPFVGLKSQFAMV